MSPAAESERRSKGPAQREPDARSDPKAEEESAMAVVSARPQQAGRKPGTGHRPPYRIAVRGPIPVNMVRRVSCIHAAALLQAGPLAVRTQPKSKHKGSKVTMEERAGATYRRQADLGGRSTDEPGGRI
jgi:hypothetical protein